MEEMNMINDIAYVLNKKNLLNGCLDREGNSTTWRDNIHTRYIEKLDLTTPVKLKRCLEELWGGDSEEIEKLIKVVVVSAFKLKSSNVVQTEQIKEKVYNF